MLLSHDECDCLHDMWNMDSCTLLYLTFLTFHVSIFSGDKWQKLPVYRSQCTHIHLFEALLRTTTTIYMNIVQPLVC